MKHLTLVAAICCITLTSFAQDWIKSYTGYNYIFRSLDFPEGQSNVGYAGGQSSTYMGDGIVIKTTDGGTTWQSLWTGVDQGIEGAAFPDLMTGYVCGWSAYFAKTTNGGTTWTVQTPGINVDYYTDVAFKDANNGVVASSTGDIWITSNGGTTWTATSGVPGSVYKLAWADGNTYFLNTLLGDIFKSTDNGLTWTISYNGSGILAGINFYNANVGIAAGEEGRIVKTNDGGATWTEQIIGMGQPIWAGFAWMNANEVIATGTPEFIWKSVDGGNTWFDDYPAASYDQAIYECIYTNNGIAYTIGSQGWFYKKAPQLSAGFTASATKICSGVNVQFTDQTVGAPTSWNWTFEGGNPPTSTQQNPLVNYPAPGVFDVTLTAGSGSNSSTLTVSNMISVSNIEPVISGDTISCINYTETFNVEEAAGSTYVWEVNGGIITGQQGAGITVQWTNAGTAEIIVTETSSMDCQGISEPFLVAVDLCTATDDLNSLQLSIYPNPAMRELNINLGKGIISEAVMTVYNNAGKLVSRSTLSPGTANHSLDITAYPAGLYFLRISTSTGEYTGRFMIISGQ